MRNLLVAAILLSPLFQLAPKASASVQEMGFIGDSDEPTSPTEAEQELENHFEQYEEHLLERASSRTSMLAAMFSSKASMRRAYSFIRLGQVRTLAGYLKRESPMEHRAQLMLGFINNQAHSNVREQGALHGKPMFDPEVRSELFHGTYQVLSQYLATNTLQLQPGQPFRIIIVGGGPVGLALANMLLELDAPNTELHLYDHRWEPDGLGVRPKRSTRRRPQVVTIQDNVTDLLSHPMGEHLFQNFADDRVWPHSRNIPIREVEDRLLEYLQENFAGKVALHAGKFTEEMLETTDAHLVVAAEGANSPLRDTVFGSSIKSHGTNYALGVSFVLPEGKPFDSELNSLVTLSQTRYLVNGSRTRKEGYLNILLSKEEYDQALTWEERKPAVFGDPSSIPGLPSSFSERSNFLPLLEEDHPLAQTILDGLALFSIDVDDVKSIERIPMNITFSAETAKLHRRPNGRNVLVTTVGDAAFSVNFWPGRGLNSGLKMAYKLKETIRMMLAGRPSRGRYVLSAAHFDSYQDFVTRLRAREHEGRCLAIHHGPGRSENIRDRLTEAAKPGQSRKKLAVADASIRQVFSGIVEGLTQRDDWPYSKGRAERDRLKIAASGLFSGRSPSTRVLMHLMGPWPLRNMGGDGNDVLP